jgi:hypothetical protein
MVDERFFAHTMPDGRGLADRVRPTHYLPERGSWVLGENLAWGSGALATPRSIVAGWMNSPGHRANVLDPGYRDIGVIVVPGSPTRRFTGGATYVADFGVRAETPATASAKPTELEAPPIAAGALLRRGIAIPVTCTHPCVIRTRVYLRHTLVGRRVERLRHRGHAKRRIRIFQRFKGRLRRHRHVRLVAVTRISGTRGARRTVVSVN